MVKILHYGENINIIGYDDGTDSKALSVSDTMDEDGSDSFATLMPNSDDGSWTLYTRAERNVLIDLRRISGKSYDQWRQAIPDIEWAAKGPFDLNLPYYGHLANLYEQAAALIRVGVYIDYELQGILDSMGWSYWEFVVLKSLGKTVLSDGFNEYRLGPLVKFLVHVSYLDGKEEDYGPKYLEAAVMSWVRAKDLNMGVDMLTTVFNDVAYRLQEAKREGQVYCLGYEGD